MIFFSFQKMSDEFRIHHLASEITSTLKSGLEPLIIAQNFTASRTPYVTAQENFQNPKGERVSIRLEILAHIQGF